MVVVRDSIIYGISLNPDDRSNDAMVPVAGLQNGYDVDFDDSEQTLYWVEHPVSYNAQILCTIINMRNGYPSSSDIIIMFSYLPFRVRSIE